MRWKPVVHCLWLSAALYLGAYADQIQWQSNYLKLGRVDVGQGGWGVERSLGVICSAAEFVMPIELVYRNTEDTAGMFGPQWRSPQLESRLIPKEKGFLAWKTPWGGEVVLTVERKDMKGRFTAVNKEWNVVENGSMHFIISRKDGWAFEYNKGYLCTITAPSGRKLVYNYTDKRLASLEQVSKTDGQRWKLAEFAYDAQGLLQSVSVAGVESRFGFDHSTPERLTSWSQGGGTPERYEYDAIGALAQVVRPDGRKEGFHTAFLFKEGKEKKASDVPALKDYSLQADADYTYDYPAFDSVTAKDKLGRTWSINFSHIRGVMTSTDPLGRKIVAKYYRQLGVIYDFKLREVKDAEGRVVVRNAYDEKGNLLRTRNLIGTATQFEINPQGKVGKVIRTYKGSEPETVAVMEYDKEGRLIVLTDALNQRQEWRYDQFGDLAEAVDQEGHRYQFNYDSRGFLLSYADAEGNLWKIDYDSQGRLARMTSPNGVKIEYKTDQAGRVTAVERLMPGGNEQATALIKRAYDAAGRPASVTDALGRTAKYEYDEQGRPASTVNPLGVATRYEYDEVNRLRSFWMQGNDGGVRGKTMLSYTALNQPEKQVDALGNELTWQYDVHGLMVGKNMGDQKIGYTYDKYGRPATVDYGEKNVVKYTYDNAGRPATVSTPMVSADYRYDKLGRLVEIIRRRGTESSSQSVGETNMLHYSYTPTGRKAAVEWQQTTSEGVTKGRTEYLYNKAGAVAEIRSDGKTVATYSYDKIGNLLGKQLADGTQELYQHDALGRITELTVKSASGKKLTQVAYMWDNADQLVRRTWDGKVQNYVYDEAGQLTGVKSESLPEERYAYDPAGNMIEKAISGEKTAMTYDLANRLLTATGKQEARYAYDPAGRIKEEILGGRATQYEYGLLGKVSRMKEGESKRVDYQYWPDGQMAWKKSRQPDAQTSDAHTSKLPNTETSYLWDGLALLARGEEKFTIEPHISGGVPMMASGKEGQTMVISDFLGTTLGVVKGEEFIPTPMTAFGESTDFASKDNSASSILHSSLFYTGKPYDLDLKAYTFLFRNYNPEIGRWTAKDPAGFPDGGNNFAYAPIPTSELDVFGLFREGTHYWGYEDDINLAKTAPSFFGMLGFTLSQRACQHCIDGTTPTISDLAINGAEQGAFVADAAFNTVRQYVSNHLKAGQHTFNDNVGITFGGVSDLAFAIHGVTVHLSGTITGSSGYLTVSFDDPYDFASSSNPLVNVFARLQANGWLSAFKITGSWSVFFSAE